MQSQRLEDHREVRVAFAVAEDHAAAHAFEGFENDVTMFGGELSQNVRPAADHGRRRALREQRGEELLVAVAQALRAVDHQHAGGFGLFQQVGGIDELIVEGRILAHQDHVQVCQRQVEFGVHLVPALGVVEHFQRAHAATGFIRFLVNILLFHIEQRPAASLRCQQHGQGAVLVEIDARDGIHHDPEAYAHGMSSTWAERRVARRCKRINGCSGWLRM
ncbi:hypothetical protein D3C81_1126700 [compost metagenome]